MLAFVLAGVLTGATPAEAARPLLLDRRWDFNDGKLTGWRHKDNATIAVVDDDGGKALRLQSGFKPFTFTWTTVAFKAHSAAGVVHLTFRVHGDGGGHKLQCQLGAPRPEGKRNLYYVNRSQAVTLDFTGWRTVSMDLDRFDTPRNGLRERDLPGVVFLEFMVHAKGEAPGVDVRLDDIAFTGYTPEEKAEMKRRRQERERTVAELTESLRPLRRKVNQLGKALDAAAAAGKCTARARVYWAALDWCVKDIGRCLEAEELEIVKGARPLAADLAKRLADEKAVLRHVLDAPPEEGDPFDSKRNPYFKSVVEGVGAQTRRVVSWPKGRKGYKSIPNAWTFRSLGDQVSVLVWSMTAPASPVRHHPKLLANALNRLDTIAHQHTDGDFNIDRTAIYGRDPNINRFCLAPALDGWRSLLRAYPDLLPKAKCDELNAGLKALADYQVTDYGLARIAKKPHVKQPAYPNMDVHHVLIMELAHQLWGDAVYAKERDAFVKILDSAVYPNGAFTYIETQNECFVYHQLNVVYSARYWQLSKNPVTLAMLKKTIPYYPYNVEPAGVPEYYTDCCWKHYWSGASAQGPETIACLFDDPLNKRVAEICAKLNGYGRGHHSAIVAELWKPVASKPLPDNYVYFDPDVEGPRGRYGAWSFAGNGRNHGFGYQGKDTFVGCMVTDPARGRYALDAALQIVTTEVRVNHTDSHWYGGRCHSAQEKLTTALGPDFGTLAVRYTIGKPNWHHNTEELFPWDGVQQWYLSRTRLVGLVALECTKDATRAAVHGRIRLGVKRKIERSSDVFWKYGKLLVRIHDHNYAKIVSKKSETFYRDTPAKYRSTEITLKDPASVKAGEKGTVRYRKGTRYHFLVEVFPYWQAPALEVKRIENGPITGLSLREPDRQVLVLHNPTDKPAGFNMAVDAKPGRTVTVFRGHKGKGDVRTGKALQIRLAAHRHVAIVIASKGK